MLLFILALLGGLAVPYLDAPLSTPLARLAERHVRLESGEVRVISLLIVLLVLAVLSWLLSSGSPFWIAVALTLGYFGIRIVAAAKEFIDSRNAG